MDGLKNESGGLVPGGNVGRVCISGSSLWGAGESGLRPRLDVLRDGEPGVDLGELIDELWGKYASKSGAMHLTKWRFELAVREAVTRSK